MNRLLGATTRQELLSAPEVLDASVDQLDEAAVRLAGLVRNRRTLLVGCGSSHLVGGLIAAALRRRTGADARAAVSSDVLGGDLGPPPDLVVAVSRSGRTSETLAALYVLRPAPAVAFVCDGSSPMAAAVEHVVVADRAAERAVAQTRSVVAGVAFGLLLAERAAGRDGRAALHATAAVLADRRADWAAEADEVAERLGPDGGAMSRGPGRLVVLGGAERWWLAREVVLKATEMGRLPAVAERLLEVPHGPVEAVTEDDVVLVLPTALPTRGPEAAVVSRLRELAGRVVVLGEHVGRGSVSEPLISQLFLGQLIALAAATRCGVDADAPARLSPFVQVEGIYADQDKGAQA